jgi:hypothetical protein
MKAARDEYIYAVARPGRHVTLALPAPLYAVALTQSMGLQDINTDEAGVDIATRSTLSLPLYGTPQTELP